MIVRTCDNESRHMSVIALEYIVNGVYKLHVTKRG